MGKTKYRILYILAGILVMLCLGTVYSYSIFRPYVEEYYQAGTTESGLPYMLSLAFYSIFMLLTGKCIERVSTVTLARIGSVLVGTGWILSGFTDNMYLLTITYGVVIGAGVGILYGVPLNLVAKWFPEQKGAATGFVLVGFGLSPLVTAPLAEKLLDQFGLHKTFQLLGAGFLVVLLLLSFVFRSLPQIETAKMNMTARAKVSFSDLLHKNNFWGLYLTFTIGTMIGLLIVGMTANVGIELFHIPSYKISRYVAFFALFNGIGRPFFGWMADKISFQKATVMSYLLLIFAAILVLLPGQDNILVYVIGFAIFWFNLGGWLAIAPAATMKLFGTENYSSNYGIVFTAYGVGAIGGVLISGMLREYFTGYTPVFVFIIILCISGLVIKSRTKW